MANRDNINWPGWTIGEEIGKGGFGRVYEMYRDEFGIMEKAALKVISIPRNAEDTDYLRGTGLDDESITTHYKEQVNEIVREYELMIGFRNCPNVVHCENYMAVEFKEGFGWNIYLKMELLTPLLKALDRVSSESQIIRLGIDLCNALAVCQKKSILHRDIKPQNIFVDEDGNFKLGDFGIARIAENASHLSIGVGTYNFMAPEVHNGQPYGVTADIYSLGLVLYWLLNKRRNPFLPLPPESYTPTMDEKAKIRRFSGESLPAPAMGSPELQQIVLRACSFDPQDRYPSAKEMKKALEAIAVEIEMHTVYQNQEEQVTIYHKKDDANTVTEYEKKHSLQTPPEDDKKKKKSSRWLLPVVIAAVLLLGILIGTVFHKYDGDTAPPQPSETESIGEEQLSSTSGNSPTAGSEETMLPTDSESGTVKTETGTDILHRNSTICAGEVHSVKINPDGTVSAVGSNEHDRSDVSGWMDIIYLSAARHTVGLTADGRVLATGHNGYGQCEVSGWMDITDVDASIRNTIGVCNDGTVMVIGDNDYGQCKVQGWSDVVDVEAGERTVYGLKSDGTVLAAGGNNAFQREVSDWSDIVSISAGFNHIVGLRSDGTVIAAGSNFYGQCDVTSWRNIIAICAGNTFTIGLRADGVVMATGNNEYGQCDVFDWSDIIEISAGMYHTIGLTSDGKIVAVGHNAWGQCDFAD